MTSKQMEERLREEMFNRFKEEDNLQRELKWLKIKLKKSKIEQRVNILENKLTIAYAVIIIIALTTLFN